MGIAEIKYIDIERANESLRRTNIKGKDYTEVSERIIAFRMLFPLGKIVTSMVSNENGVCIFRAEVYADNETLLGTGTAYEKENSTYINKTSYIENCETSAVGRALGMCGLGIDNSVASAEDVAKSEPKQKYDKTPREKLIAKLHELNIDVNEYAQRHHLTSKTTDETFIELLADLEG